MTKRDIYAELDALHAKISAIDQRDTMQYDAAKKILMDMNSVLTHKVDDAITQVCGVKKELDSFMEWQEGNNKILTSSLVTIDTKLNDIQQNGTALARQIAESITHVKVNGGTYQLGEALGHINDLQKQTHSKIKDLTTLTEGIGARKQFWKAASHVIEKDDFAHFALGSKIGRIVFITLFIIVLNTILHALSVELDLQTIFTWVFSFIK